MKATRTMAMAVGAALLALGAFAAPSVEITSVQQQYPWTNTVDIVYTVAGVESETNGYFVVFSPTTSTGAAIPDVNGETSVQVALKGSGVYSTQWFPQTNLQYTACKMTPAVFRGAAKDYMIVDLETGAVTYEPMATQAASNQRYNTDEYKTKKLVLRRIPANNEYWVGVSGGESYQNSPINSRHSVSIGKDYYIGVFELTEAQWERIVNANNTSTSTLPKGGTSWNLLRGSALPAAVPTSGVMANLNKKTGLVGFDLPTFAMWEIAARAGCATKYLSGDTVDDVGKYGWYSKNSGNVAHKVGLKEPNAWGLYDVMGNMFEKCRDICPSASTDVAGLQTNGLVPLSASGSNSAQGGGSFTLDAAYMSLSRWGTNSKTGNNNYHGCRISFVEQ